MIVPSYPGKGVPAGSQVGAFGDKFRTERERRGFTLDDVSNVTKINSRMLRAIEEEHFDLLPGGVFNKGFVRAYAKHLGFNDEEAVSEYLTALRQAQVQAQTAAWQPELPPQPRAEQRPVARVRPPQPSPEQARAEQVREESARGEQPAAEKVGVAPVRVAPKLNPPAIKVGAATVADEVKRHVQPDPKLLTNDTQPAAAREFTPTQSVPVRQQKYPPADLELGRVTPRADSIPWKVPAVVLGVILVAAVLWNRHSRGVRAEEATQVPQAPVAAATNPVETRPAAAAATFSSSGSNRGSKSGPASSVVGAASHDLSANPSPATRDAADRSAIDHAGTDVAASYPAAVAPVRKSAAALAAKTPPVFTLRIRASETSWISVAADGQPALQETLIAPASTTIRATHEITVRVSNGAAVRFLLNGKEIPAQGNEGEAKTFTFDNQGVKQPSQAAAPDSAH